MCPRANPMGLLALLGSPGFPFYWNRLRLCCCTLTLCLKSHIYNFIMSKYNNTTLVKEYISIVHTT